MEVLYSKLLNPSSSESKRWRRVQYADDVVVVNKPKPEKAGNSLEDINLGDMEYGFHGHSCSKGGYGCEGRKEFKVYSRTETRDSEGA